MTLREAHKKQIAAKNECTARNGYTLEQSKLSLEWTFKVMALASVLGWDHEIITDDCSEEYESIILNKIEAEIDDREMQSELSTVYEMVACLAEGINHVSYCHI